MMMIRIIKGYVVQINTMRKYKRNKRKYTLVDTYLNCVLQRELVLHLRVFPGNQMAAGTEWLVTQVPTEATISTYDLLGVLFEIKVGEGDHHSYSGDCG